MQPETRDDGFLQLEGWTEITPGPRGIGWRWEAKTIEHIPSDRPLDHTRPELVEKRWHPIAGELPVPMSGWKLSRRAAQQAADERLLLRFETNQLAQIQPTAH